MLTPTVAEVIKFLSACRPDAKVGLFIRAKQLKSLNSNNLTEIGYSGLQGELVSMVDYQIHLIDRGGDVLIEGKSDFNA